MIPPRAHPVWRLLVTGREQVQSSNLAFSMLMSNCRICCLQDSSPASVSEMAAHAFEFFTKYEEVLPAELRQLDSLGAMPKGGRADAVTNR